jgi:hypothetical protein
MSATAPTSFRLAHHKPPKRMITRTIHGTITAQIITRPNTKSLMHELALLLKRSKYVRSITLTTIVNRWTSMIMSTLGQMVLEYSI